VLQNGKYTDISVLFVNRFAMKHYLVPIDYSENSLNALQYALKLAALIEGRVTTLHIAPQGTFTKLADGSINPADDALLQYSEKSEKVFRDLIAGESVSTPVVHVFEQGRVVEGILNTAKREDTDMIVMGTKGASGLKEVIFGSNTAKTIEGATIPVLAIPEDAVYSGLHQIAYSTSFRIEEIDTMLRVLNLAKLANAKLHMVHVNLPHTTYAYERMEELQESLSDQDNVVFHVIEDIDVVKGLAKYVRSEKIEMLVMLTEHRSFLERLFDRSYTGQMAYYTETPLLVFK